VDGDDLGGIPSSGEVSKEENMVEKKGQVGKSFTREVP
jgi:hypothetical protein